MVEITQEIFLPVLRNPSGSQMLFEKFISILAKKSSFRLAQDLRHYTISFFKSNGLIPGGGNARNFLITVSFEFVIYLEGQIYLRPFYFLRHCLWFTASFRLSSRPTRRLFARIGEVSARS